MLRTTLQLMWGRKGNLLGSLVAFTLSVTFMLAMVTIMVSTFGGPGETVRFGEADFVVQVDMPKALGIAADEVREGIRLRVPVDDQERIAALPGVASAVPVTLFPAQVLKDDGTPVDVSADAVPRGQAWATAALTPFTVADGRAPEATNEIVIDGRIARAGRIEPGDEVMVATGVATSRYIVTGIAVTPDGEGLDRQASVFFQGETSSRLAATGGAADVMGVFLREDADASDVAAAIRNLDSTYPLEVLRGEARGKADVAAGRDLVTDMGALLGVMAGFVGFVTIFVLASTFGFAVQQRHREIGLLRAIGYTPKQVRRAILAESVVIGALGSAIGIVLSSIVAQAVVRIMIAWGKLPGGFAVAPSLLAVVIVVPAGIGIALLSAWLASRKTSRISPLETLQDAAVPAPRLGFWRWVWGLVFLIAGAAAISASGAVPAAVGIMLSLAVIISWSIACAVLGPAIVHLGARLLSRLPGMASAEPDVLAIHNTRHQAFRVASVVTPIVLAVGMTTMMFGFAPTQEASTVRITEGRMTADLYLVPETGVLSPDVFERVRDLPGVTSLTLAVPVDIGIQSDDVYSPYTALAVDTGTIADVMDLKGNGDAISTFGPGTIVLDAMNEIDVPGSPGSDLHIMWPDGSTRDLAWVASASNLIGAGDALVSINDIPAGSGVGLAMVDLADHASMNNVVAHIAGMRPDGLAVAVMTHDQYVEGVGGAIQQQAWASNLIIGSAAAFGVLAAINTLVMSIAERRREFALMRMIGASQPQVMRMIRTEAIIASVIAIALGAVVGALSLIPVSIGITGNAGSVRISIAGVTVSAIAALLIVLGTSLWAVRPALHVDVATAMSTRE